MKEKIHKMHIPIYHQMLSLMTNCRKDSIVSERINYDLLKKAKGIQEGTIAAPELLGHGNKTKTMDNIPTAIRKHMTCP